MNATLRDRRAQDAFGALARGLGVVTLALASFAFGLGLVAVATTFGGDVAPALVVAIPLVPLIIGAILNDPRFAVATVFLSFPLGFAALPLGLLELQAVDVAVLVVVVVVALARIGSGRAPLAWMAPMGWQLAWVAWAVISLTSAPDQTLATKQVGYLISGLLFVSVVVAVLRKVSDVRAMAILLVVIGALITLPALAQSGEFRSYYGGSLVEGRLQGLFTEPNELGSFCSMAALVAAGAFLGARSTRQRQLAGVAFVVLASGLVLSLSRGAWVGSIVGIVLLMVSLRQARRAIVLVSLPLITVAALIGTFGSSSPQVQVVGQRIGALTDLDQPYDNRPEIWGEALRQIRDDPLTGQGPGNFRIGSQRYASASLTVYSPHAHNLYLNVAAEVGLPAVTFLIGLVVTLAVIGRRLVRLGEEDLDIDDRSLVAGISAALASVAVQGLFNSFQGNALLDTTTWGLVGMLLVAYRAKVRTTD